MPKTNRQTFTHLDVVKHAQIADGPVIWFELDEVDARLLAKGIVAGQVKEQAAACVAWLDEDPSGYLDRTTFVRARETTRPANAPHTDPVDAGSPGSEHLD